MESMKTSRLLILICTGIISPLVLLALLLDNESKLGWLDRLLLGPGSFVAQLFVSDGPPGHRPVWFFYVSFGLNFVFLWVVLMILAFLLEKLITRRTKHA
ncbi:MAG: hypothetical protein ABSG96_02395 [Terracidiphilus sp.]|jgi:hypothetical protein